jgi:putative transposase
VIQRAFRYRLYPTAEQASLMEATANARRFVYNLALEQRRDFWRQAKAAGVTLNYISQGRELTQLRAELPWLAAVHSTPLIQALRDLDRAYSGFFSRRAGFPRFQAKDRQMSFRHKACEARIGELGPKWAKVRVPKIGFVDMRLTRPIIGRVISVTFVRDALGWHASFVCEIKHESAETNLPHVGIDRGVTNTIALSTGELLSTPDIVMLDRRKREAQRTLSRKTRGSARHTKQRQRLAKLAAKCVRIRSHWQHETSTMIAARFGVGQ